MFICAELKEKYQNKMKIIGYKWQSFATDLRKVPKQNEDHRLQMTRFCDWFVWPKWLFKLSICLKCSAIYMYYFQKDA